MTPLTKVTNLILCLPPASLYLSSAVIDSDVTIPPIYWLLYHRNLCPNIISFGAKLNLLSIGCCGRRIVGARSTEYDVD